MSLLELDHVGKGCARPGQRPLLDDVCLCVEAGEMVGVWGRRRSGRSTLLRVAAGLEPPDTGVVRFDGADLRGRSGAGDRGGLRFCRKRFRPIDGALAIDQLVTSQLVCGIGAEAARERAQRALARVGVAHCANVSPGELDLAEQTLVAIARSLTHAPRLLIVDEPTLGVDICERDAVIAALRALRSDGVSVLLSAGETTSLTGADRVLSIAGGVLRGETEAGAPATVVDLQERRAAGAGNA